MIALPPGVERTVDVIYPVARQALAVRLSDLEIRIFFGSAAQQLALLLAYFYTGAAAWTRDAIARKVSRPFLASTAFVAISFAGYALWMAPLDWYAGFSVPHAYGLSRETPATWIHDWAVGNAVSLVVLLVLALLFWAAVARLGGRWPVAAGLAAAPLIVFGNAIFPTYVAPLFNHYAELKPSPLTTSILALASREGIDASAVYEYDMSRQTTEGNAYVAGLGPTARIAIGDNLLRDLSADEVQYVVAHEMGHYKLHHIWWGSLYGWIGAIAAIVFLAVAARPSFRIGAAHRVRSLDDPAALPLVAALLLCFSLATQPIANGVSRSIEQAADTFAASQTNLGDAGMRAFARLGDENLSVLHPQPAVVWYFYTHPPLADRIAYAVANERAPGHGGLTDFRK